MSKKVFRNITLSLAALFCIMLGMVVGSYLMRNSQQQQIIQLFRDGSSGMFNSDEQSNGSNKIATTLSLIEQLYVDSIGIDTLVEGLMPKLIERLDPHSSYIPAKDLKRVNESLDGEFDGIGVVFNMATDTVIVLNVIPSGPSDKAGILARDRIIRINDSLVAGRKVRQDSIVGKLRGKRNTKVKLSVERQGIDGLVDIVVTRGKVTVHSIGAKLIVEDGVGYINLQQFARNTYSEFIDAMNELLKQGMTSLVLDLRGNAGGFMDQAILIANEFLPKGSLIVYTEDRMGNQQKEYNKRDGQLQNIPLMVLIDEGSASSSEIVAGALQDNDRGTIIGRRSFGKGLVQRQIPYTDGSALRLTIARYYTPTGRSIQKPYEKGEGEAYSNEIRKRVEHNELFTADSIAFADSLRYTTPKGRTVYGGGGIMPDIFVPIKTDSLPEFYVEVAGRNILYRYTIDYSDRHRDDLAAVLSMDDLNRLFKSDKRLVDDFIAHAKREGIEGSEESIEASRSILEHQLRAFIGRNTVLEDNGYFMNIYTIDDTMLRALEELRLAKESK